MAIKIASWNVEGRLSGYRERGRGSARDILAGIEKLDADIVVLPEAYLGQSAEGVDEQLGVLGYTWQDCEYSRDERDWSKEFLGIAPTLRVLSRLELMDVHIAPRLLVFTARDPKTKAAVRIFAVHLDDRNEVLREKQMGSFAPMLKKTQLPYAVVGDFNAMWPTGRARLLRSRATRFLARHFPHAGLRHSAIRLTDMAAGRVLTGFERLGLRDADPHHRPTTTPKMRDSLFLPSIRLAQIDHILLSGELDAAELTISPDWGSDHRAITTSVTVKS